MNKLAKYIIIITVTTVVLFLAWYFSAILSSIIVAAVLSLIGKPIMNLLTSLKIGKLKINSAVAALITMIILGSILLLFIIFLTPLIGKIIREMSAINLNHVNQKLAIPLYKYNLLLHHMFPTIDKSITIELMIMEQFKSVFNFNLFTNAFSSVTSFLVHFAVTSFTIVFVTFFFLKDNNTFTNMILAFVPEQYEDNTRRALDVVNNLLVRYFTGISIEAILITIINTIGLHFIGGVNFQLAVVLAFLSGVFNVIPYIGPIFAGIFGTIMGVISHYGGVADPVLGTLIVKLVLIFFTTHIIDVFIFQPYIYSNSVKAHPLEIFLIILVAGNIGGIIGMLIAIPAYTVIRVFAREFFYRFKLVQRLTDRIE
ncbi:MAG: AI-2E family transporter [Bacteroidales bacterium]